MPGDLKPHREKPRLFEVVRVVVMIGHTFVTVIRFIWDLARHDSWWYSS